MSASTESKTVEQIHAELRESVATLSWLHGQLLTAPDAPSVAKDVFAAVDQPLTRGEVLASIKFHAGRILETV